MVITRKVSDLFSEIESVSGNAKITSSKRLEYVSPNYDDSVICGELYVRVQTMVRTRLRVAGNTIPTAREGQDVVHFRGESRPALFPACGLQSNNFFPSISIK